MSTQATNPDADAAGVEPGTPVQHLSALADQPVQESVTERQRGSYMAALSVAEQVASGLPVLPDHFETNCPRWDSSRASLRLYFHHAPEAVRTNAAFLGAGVTETRGKTGLYTTARCELDGVTVELWALTSASEAVAS